MMMIIKIKNMFEKIFNGLDTSSSLCYGSVAKDLGLALNKIC